MRPKSSYKSSANKRAKSATTYKPYKYKISVPRFCETNGFYTTPQRSAQMAKIKASGTKPEVKLRKALWTMGLRYRKNVKSLPGKPDLVFRKHRLVIFIDGEFWHGYKWDERKKEIKTNRIFWISKIERNIQRDQEINLQLSKMGFHVLRFWESQVKLELFWCTNQILEYLSEEQAENPILSEL